MPSSFFPRNSFDGQADSACAKRLAEMVAILFDVVGSLVSSS